MRYRRALPARVIGDAMIQEQPVRLGHAACGLEMAGKIRDSDVFEHPLADHAVVVGIVCRMAAGCLISRRHGADRYTATGPL